MTYEYDLHSDGSALVTLTIFVENRGSIPVSTLNETFSQGITNLFVHDLITNQYLSYTVTSSSAKSFNVSIFLQPVLKPNDRTILQYTYYALQVAALSSNAAEAIQGVWIWGITFPQLPTFRLSVKLPPNTEPVDYSPPNIPQIYAGKYLDTDNRWVVTYAVQMSPPQTLYLIKYRIATRLWSFAVAPALILVAMIVILRIIRPKAVKHAKEVDDKPAAYDLWQMSLAIHLTIVAAVVASWGLLLSVENSPSIVDVAMLIEVVIVIVLFRADTNSYDEVLRSFKKK